jgi:excisionase family DNA binding protein
MTIQIEKAAFNRAEAAAYLGMAQNTLIKLLDAGTIKHIRAGRRLIIPKMALDRFLDVGSK